MDDADEQLSITQAQKLLGCSRKTVYNHEKKGLLRIDHDHKGKPFILRSQVDLVLQKKKDQVRKTEYVPDGCVVVNEDSYNAAQQRLTFLESQRLKLIKYEEQAEVDREHIESLEENLDSLNSSITDLSNDMTEMERVQELTQQEKEATQAELERLKNRGFFARVFNKGGV